MKDLCWGGDIPEGTAAYGGAQVESPLPTTISREMRGYKGNNMEIFSPIVKDELA